MSSPSYLFRCKTHDAYIVKNLVELLQNNIKIGCFDIKKSGIYLRMMDSNKRLLVDVTLEASRFYHFHYQSKQPVIHVGINLNHLYKLLKSIKKKDSIQLFITDDDPTNLGIRVISKDKSPPLITASSIKIQNIQNLEIHLPNPYDHSILVSTMGFSKMCKDMTPISHTMTINIYQNHVDFFSNINNIFSRQHTLGDTEESNSTTNQDQGPLYMEEFDSEIFLRIAKLCGLGQNMHMLFHQDLPILLKASIGNLGTIMIFVKTRSQIAETHLSSSSTTGISP